MDFVSGLPRSRKGCDSIWVIVDHLNKPSHFLPMKTIDKLWKLGKLFVDEIVRLYGVPMSIVLDRDPCFTSNFWAGLLREFGTKLRLSIVFHLRQMDSQKELSKLSRTCCELVCWIWKVIRKNVYHWWSLPITIVSILVLAWHLLKLYMKGSVGR